MRQRLQSTRLFLRQFRSQFQWTGAVMPSSRFLAHELTRFLRQRSGEPGRPLRILEVGPGTGPITQLVCATMQPGDQFDLVEINPKFVEHLQQRFAEEQVFRNVADQTRILCEDVRKLDAAQKYDVILSGLPFNNFAAEDVRSILQRFETLLTTDGRCSFFEYIAIRNVKAWAVPISRAERKRLREVESVIRQFLQHEERRSPVFCNVLPAWVHHVRVSNASRELSPTTAHPGTATTGISTDSSSQVSA